MRIYVTEKDIRKAKEARSAVGGKYMASKSCPIAQAIGRRIVVDFAVHLGSVHIGQMVDGKWSQQKIYLLPFKAMQFMNNFDLGTGPVRPSRFVLKEKL